MTNMKIDVVTFSCDSSPIYYEFWNPISKYWKTKLNIHPVLLYYGNENIFLSEEYGEVFRFPEQEEIPRYMAGCWGRFWLTQKYSNLVCMTGDIDLIVLRKKYLTENTKNHKNEDYIHLNSKPYDWKNIFPATYHVALGKTFKKVYSLESDFYKEMKRYINSTNDYSGKIKYAFHPEKHLRHASVENGGKWGHDEAWTTEMLKKYYKKGGVVITEVGIEKRVDRSNWSYNPQDVKNGEYIDAHLPRPYSKHKNKIDSLMDLIKD